MNNKIGREYVEHHCTNCNARITPFSKFEAETQAPDKGARGGFVLLRSFNAAHREARRAYCWSCKEMVVCERLTEDEIIRMYLDRDGVGYRMGKKALKSYLRRD